MLPGLKFRTSFGLDYNNYNESEYWNSLLIAGSPNGYATSNISQYTTWLNEQTLTYRKRIGSHSFGVLLGNTLQNDNLIRTYAEGRGFPNNSFTQIASAATTAGSQNWSKSTLSSFFGKVDYNFGGNTSSMPACGPMGRRGLARPASGVTSRRWVPPGALNRRISCAIMPSSVT